MINGFTIVIFWITAISCILGSVFCAVWLIFHIIALVGGKDRSKYPSFFKCVWNLLLFLVLAFLFHGCATANT